VRFLSSSLAEIASLAGIVISLFALYFSVKLYSNASSRIKYFSARLFLARRETVGALTLMVAAMVIFVFGRLVSFLIIFGFMGEEVIYYVRNPIDIVSTIMLVCSLAKLHSITRFREVQV